VVEALERGELLILDIDVQGARQVRATLPGALFIFIEPPSDEELLRRLRSRGREDEGAIERRFREAKHEIAQARRERLYDHYIVNDDLEQAVRETCDLISRRRVAS
jgi:guanylate kinase